MLDFLLDLLFPRRSLAGSEGEWITEEERKQMRLFPVRLQKELLRKRGIHHLDCLIAAGSERTTPLLKKAIRTFKYGRIRDLGTELGKRISDILPGLLILPDHQSRNQNSQVLTVNCQLLPVVCAVPLHWTRRFHRGFNQAEILAAVIVREHGYPMKNILKRHRPTGHQAHRKRPERLTALRDAFTYIGDSPAPACVLLVDDICTTGATLDACADTLKRAGVQHVIGLTVAHE